MRVMFVHGIESSPQWPKVRLMTEQGLEVVAPHQHMSAKRLDRHNSVVRQLLRMGAGICSAGRVIPWCRDHSVTSRSSPENPGLICKTDY